MKKLFLLFFSLFANIVLFAQEMVFSSNLACQVGTGIFGSNRGELLTAQTLINTNFKSYINESYLFIDAFAVFDALNAQSEDSRVDFVTGKNRISLKLKEAYFDYMNSNFVFRIGRQISAWGKADGLLVSDVLCPKSSTLIAEDYRESRMGVDSVKLSYSIGTFQADLWWIPFFTPAALPFAEENPLKKLLFPDKINGLKVNEITSNNIYLPKLKIYNGEYACRLAAYLPFADLGFYAFYGWDDEPFIKYSSDSVSVTLLGHYERMIMFAADAAIPVKDVILRLESAYYPLRHMQVSGKSQFEQILMGNNPEYSTNKNELINLAGFDWAAPLGFTLTGQYWFDFIFGNITEIEKDFYTHQATLSIQKSFANDNLVLSANAAVDCSSGSTAVSIKAEGKISDAISLYMIANLFLEGSETGLYGRFKDLSCITLKGVYRF